MDVPHRPDDALGHPTRARLFALLAELRRPAGTGELAELLELHPNGVRVHLGRLLEDGLVARERVPGRRGRPRDMWMVAPRAHPGGRAPSGYAQLGRWLVRILGGGAGARLDVADGGRIPARRIEAAGRQIGRELAPTGEGSVDEKMHGALSAMGFQPQVVQDGGSELCYRLGNCPFCEAVREGPEVVCGLHRGITRGLLDVIAPKARLVAFVPGGDPARAGCLIRLRCGSALHATPSETSPRKPAPTPPARSIPTPGRSP